MSKLGLFDLSHNLKPPKKNSLPKKQKRNTHQPNHLWHSLLRYTYLYNKIHENTKLHKMRFYSMNIKEFTWVKSSYSLHYYQIKLVRNIFGSKHHAIKQKLMPHILSEHYFPTSFNTGFLKAIHLTIRSHEHKVRDYHMIKT